MYFSIGNIIKVTQFFFFIHSFGSKSLLYNSKLPGVYEGGAGCRSPPYACPRPEEGGQAWRAHLILHLFAFPFLRQYTLNILHCIALHSHKLKD